jgi:CUB domain
MSHEVQLIIFVALIGPASLQFGSCDYSQTLTNGTVYSIASTRYPQNYRRGDDCRWAVVAPPGYRATLSCDEVAVPVSFLCLGDSIFVSRTGRTDVRDGRRYCGNSSFYEKSDSTRMTIIFRPGLLTRGGRFKCTMRAVEDTCSCGQLNRGKIGKFARACEHKSKKMKFQLTELRRK